MLTGESQPVHRGRDDEVFVLVGALVPRSALLGFALWERRTPLGEAVPTSVAAGVTLVPEG